MRGSKSSLRSPTAVPGSVGCAATHCLGPGIETDAYAVFPCFATGVLQSGPMCSRELRKLHRERQIVPLNGASHIPYSLSTSGGLPETIIVVPGAGVRNSLLSYGGERGLGLPP